MDDLISRAEAIEALGEKPLDWLGSKYEEGLQEQWEMDVDAIKALPSRLPDVIRCKDCKWWGYDDDDGVVRVCRAAKHGHMSPNWSIMIYRTHKGDFYCADAERKEGEADAVD